MNMKNRLSFFKMLLFVALMATWTSCSKSDDIEANDPKPVNPTPTNPTNPTDKTDPKDDPYMVVCEHVEKVAKSVDTYYDQCHSMEELKQHLDDIKKIEYVEDIYTTETTMFVKIKDFGTIFYSFFIEPEAYDFSPNSSNAKSIRKAPSVNISNHPSLETKSICIANAQLVEYLVEGRMQDRKILSEKTREYFEQLGYNTVLLNAPNLHFFSETMFNYDIVYLITHGVYNSQSNLHWIIGNEVSNSNIIKADDIYKHKDYPRDQVTYSKYTYVGNKYNPFDNRTVSWYVAISENFINKSVTKKVKNEKYGKTLFFNVACQSLKGNDNLGNALLEKGFGAYYGYDESNYYGQRAYFYMLNKLLSGMSLENALNALPDSLKDESKAYYTAKNNPNQLPKAKLHKLYNSQNEDIGNSCIARPTINKPDNLSSEKEIRYNLTGSALFYSYYFAVEGDKWYIKQDPLFSYGFFISETSDFKDATMVCSNNSENISYSNNTVSFNFTLLYNPSSPNNIIIPEKDYYVWAYIFDGKDYYLSDMKSFITPALKDSDNPNPDTNTSGQGNLPNVPGSDL